jgi:hypothetical protein
MKNQANITFAMVCVIVTTPKPFKINYENFNYIFQKKNVIKWELLYGLYIICKKWD